MNPIDAITKVIDWKLSRKKERNSEVRSHLQDIRETCEELVSLEDFHSDKAKLLHEQIKVMYDNISSRLPELDSSTSWNIYNALSSARIYYWLRVYEQQGEQELSKLIKERRKLSPSNDALMKELRMAYVQRNDKFIPGSIEIEKIRVSCLRVIAYLSNVYA